MRRLTPFFLASLAASPLAAAPNWAPLSILRGDFARWQDQRLAVFVTARVGKLDCLMQLDTGIDDAVHWQSNDGAPLDERVTVQVAGASWDVAISKPNLQHLEGPQGCKTGHKVGNIGTGFFGLGTLTLDLAQERLGYEVGSQLPKAGSEPLRYARWGNWGGFPLVEIRQNGKLRGRALFDSGSAAIGLSLLEETDWQAALASHTGQDQPVVSTTSLSSWGRQLNSRAAEIDSPWQAGSMPLGRLRIVHVEGMGFKPGEPLVGVLGLQSFGKAVITLDLPSERWKVTP